MNDYMALRRLALTATLACGAFAAWAMPTKTELAQAQQLVQDLTAEDLRAMKAGTKKPGEVAAAQLAFADEAETEAGKYLLLQGAFKLYARSADYDAAADVLARMRKEIADLPPEVVVELVNTEMRRVAAEKAPKVLAIFRDAQRTMKCRKELKTAEAAAKAKPDDKAAQRRLAECHAGLGDWPKALEIFAKIGDEAAKFEQDPASAKGFNAMKAANYWWEYAAKDAEPFKAHAAALYKKGLEDGSITGLRKTLAEKRVKEMENAMTASSVAARGSNTSVASGKAPSNGLYCVIDLSAGPTANKYPVKWFDKPPTGGFNTDEYKTKKLVLRRIEPGKFMMGGKYEVTLTKPFYCGVFEVTQKQYERVTGSIPSRFNNDMSRPVERVSWNMIRGDSTTYNWPTSVNVDPSSFMGKMQIRTGLNFDLPTEAQWEYACRAGSDGEFGGTGRLDDMGWHKDNSGGTTHPVGQKQANAWGIYDMHGNVGEICLDWKGSLLGGETDPVGSFSGSRRVCRGGCWCESEPRNCSSSARCYGDAPSSSNSHFGFRLCMNPEAHIGVSAQGNGAPAAS
ncbi:MAG: SUMF1/EgtB/PvdO family nonheme iron enzyme, partial [Kiritimatiellae bacterium]|nr:SUMF1/EgtB/PvdO family nonheme iron enzyme [Kiritimatiellia bacterium]